MRLKAKRFRFDLIVSVHICFVAHFISCHITTGQICVGDELNL